MRSDRFDQLIRRIAVRRGGSDQASTVVPCRGPDDFCPEGGIADPRITTIASSPVGCLPGNSVCSGDVDCCSGVCTMHGRCGCFDAGHLCPNDGYCCSSNCRDHRCV